MESIDKDKLIAYLIISIIVALLLLFVSEKPLGFKWMKDGQKWIIFIGWVLFWFFFQIIYYSIFPPKKKRF